MLFHSKNDLFHCIPYPFYVSNQNKGCGITCDSLHCTTKSKVSTEQCATFNKDQGKLVASDTSTATLYVRDPIQ